MIKKTITYTDYDGNERTEDLFFNLSKAELIEMELSASGGMEKMLKRIIAEQDTRKIMEIVKSIILKSYGKKSDDGRRFIKSEELSQEFLQTEAYSELLLELMSNEEAASAFMNGLVDGLTPSDTPVLKTV
jgi:phage-related baseplate assembly protein